MITIGKRIRCEKKAISPILATLFLILITIAASVLAYVYVINFSSNSQAQQPQTLISIETFCVSLLASQCNSNGYFVEISNTGSASIPAGAVQLYFSDESRGTSAEATCQITSPVGPTSTFSCPSVAGTQLPAALNALSGDFISLQVLCPDGTRATSSAKVLAGATSYVPITLTNSKPVATQDDLQILVNVDFDSYTGYLSSDVGNIRFYNSTNFALASELPAWLENYTGGSGQPNSATSSDVWVELVGTIIPASSQTTIYMVFDSTSVNFDGVYWGEAPQLSSSYGQYDNGAKVFFYYNAAPGSTTGWTVAGTAGSTASAPAGSYFHTQNAYYANSAKGDYLYTQISGLAENVVVTFWTYTTGLGNVYFLASSAGAGQMGRFDSRGGGDYSGLATTTTWTSWTAPGAGLDESKDKWYKYDIVINGTEASSYIGASTNNLGTLGSLANLLTVSDDGNYLGIVGDALGGTYISYWNGIIIRLLPPDAVAPSVSFGSVN